MSKRSKQAWVTSTFCPVSKKLSAFEKFAKSLDLDPEDLSACSKNNELTYWVTKNLNTVYVPEQLLSALKLHTEWGSGQRHSNPRISYEDIRAELKESQATPQISTH